MVTSASSHERTHGSACAAKRRMQTCARSVRLQRSDPDHLNGRCSRRPIDWRLHHAHLELGSAAILVVLVRLQLSGATGSPAASAAQPGGQASAPGGQPSVAPAGSVAGRWCRDRAAPRTAAGAGACASQAAGGGGGSTGLAAKPCSLMTEAEVAGILHGAMVATPKAAVDGVDGHMRVQQRGVGQRGHRFTSPRVPRPRPSSTGTPGPVSLAPKSTGSATPRTTPTARSPIWKGDHGVGISIDQSDATDEASLKALAVALGKVAAGRL